MKGKIKSIFVHIINGIFVIGAVLVFALLLKQTIERIMEGKSLDTSQILSIIVFAIPSITSILAETFLIIKQAKHRYGISVLVTGIINNAIFIIVGGVLTYVSLMGDIVDGEILAAGITILLIPIANLVLYILIHRDNKGVAATPAKAIEAPAAKKEVVAEDKPEVSEKEPVVAEKKPVAVAKKPATAKKPAAVKKASAKKAAPKKVVAKKPAAKNPAAKKPATKKPAAKKKK